MVPRHRLVATGKVINQASASDKHIPQHLRPIDKGLPGGHRYSDSAAAKQRAAWQVVVKHVPDKTKVQAREIIQVWLKNGVLRKDEYQDPERNETVSGLFVNANKRPK
jgi:hypothetical protein